MTGSFGGGGFGSSDEEVSPESSELIDASSSQGNYGSSPYGSSPYSGAHPPFGLESAVALTSTRVRVRYTAMFDAAHPPLLSVATYSIQPALTIKSVSLESAQTVVLRTTQHAPGQTYTVAIESARGHFGEPLAPNLRSANFVGEEGAASFYAVATRGDRVRAVFASLMFPNAALVDSTQYVLTDLDGQPPVDWDGHPISIASVYAEQATAIRATVLELSGQLRTGQFYQLRVLDTIVSAAEQTPIVPASSVFQWLEGHLTTQIPVSQFSGEVVGGLYGLHNGLVFFSPALQSPAPNSIIQVEQVDVCTKAFDEYVIPQPAPTGRTLMTHGASVAPTFRETLLNVDLLWQGFPGSEVKFELDFGTTPYTETMPAAADGPAVATLQEIWPAERVSLLNNTLWKLRGDEGSPTEYFITADNLTPFPASPPVVITL